LTYNSANKRHTFRILNIKAKTWKAETKISELKCKGCGERFPKDEMIKVQLSWYHSFECASASALAKIQRKAATNTKKKEKADRAKQRNDKEKVKTMAEWFDQLQTLVNQYVVHVKDYGEPCCTCQKTTQNIKYDAGHMRSRGSTPELRFELTNIHKQCSVNCNQHGSGMRKEYELFIIDKYGKDHLDWLNGPHPSLKEQFPHYADVKNEIIRYRKLLRDAGLKPYC